MGGDVIQTFLPLEDFAQSAKVLDMQRLGKQRVECLQILKALADPTYGWQNHPAVAMWRGSDGWLREYGIAICQEWKRRGYVDTCEQKLRDIACGHTNLQKPWWLGDPRLHISHQSNLLRKAPWAYAHLWPGVDRGLEYWWPSKSE